MAEFSTRIDRALANDPVELEFTLSSSGAAPEKLRHHRRLQLASRIFARYFGGEEGFGSCFMFIFAFHWNQQTLGLCESGTDEAQFGTSKLGYSPLCTIETLNL